MIIKVSTFYHSTVVFLKVKKREGKDMSGVVTEYFINLPV